MKLDDVLARIAEEVNKFGGKPPPRAEIVRADGINDGERTDLVIDGVSTKFLVELKPESRFRGTKGGPARFRMNIGKYGSKTHFIQRRGGDFDYPKAARILVGLARQYASSAQDDSTLRQNTVTAAQLTTELGLEPVGYITIDGTADRATPLKCVVRMSRVGTFDQVRVWASDLQERLYPVPKGHVVIQMECADTYYKTVSRATLLELASGDLPTQDRERLLKERSRFYYVYGSHAADYVVVPDDDESWEDLRNALGEE